MDDRLLEDIYVAKLEILPMQANNPLKLDNMKNNCLLNTNVLYFSFSLNISEYP